MFLFKIGCFKKEVYKVDLTHEKNIFDNDEEIMPFKTQAIEIVNDQTTNEDVQIEDFFSKNNLDFNKFSESEEHKSNTLKAHI